MSFHAVQFLLYFVSYHFTTSLPSIFPLVRKKNFFNVNNSNLFSNISLPIQHRRRLALMMGNFVHPTISDDYFHAILYIGTPPQRVEMALDTGSGLPYFACQSTCKHCGKHDDPHFNITGSKSFEWLPCKSNLCSGSCKSKKCEWSQKYIDKSSISALVASDRISFYSWPYFPKQKSQTISESVEYQWHLRLVFGCSVREANTIFRQGADGVMGLSMHRRSFVDQLFTHNTREFPLGKKQFAHCFGQKTGGLLLFGSKEINQLLVRFNIQLQWASFLTKNNGHGWYKVKTVGFRIETHHPLTSSTSIDVKYVSSMNSGYRGSVMDTGSSTFSLPARPAKDIREAIIIIINKISPNSETFGWEADKTKNYDFFLTWNGESKCSREKWLKFKAEYLSIFPDIIMLLENRDSENVEFKVQSKQYLLYKKQKICLDLFGDTPSILIGSNVMVDKFIVYDREEMKLGIANFNCDLLMNVADNENSTSLKYVQSHSVSDESDSYIEPLLMSERKFEEHKFVIHINIFNWKTYIFYFLSLVTFLVMYWIFGRKLYQYLCSSVCKNKKIASVKNEHFGGNRKIRGKRKRVNENISSVSMNDDSYMFVNSVNEKNGLHNINIDVLSQTTPMTNFASDLKSSTKHRE